MTLAPLGIALLLCVLPSLLFLGLWHGLCRMRRHSFVTRTCERAGRDDPTVTWGDVFDAYADPEKRLIGPSPSSNSRSRSHHAQDDRCPICEADNDSFASFCHGCLRRLE
ncbi:zinc ribbon domain-containing protein [Natrialbaceae archaeon GCM10025810]|uniref:zinc ribbon domain-containing protein n=1 Tax=Halovalidus salilacus TaxID=3075124 RepID=UPI00362409CD